MTTVKDGGFSMINKMKYYDYDMVSLKYFKNLFQSSLNYIKNSLRIQIIEGVEEDELGQELNIKRLIEYCILMVDEDIKGKENIINERKKNMVYELYYYFG